MTLDINRKVFENTCSLILEDKSTDLTKKLYMCDCGFIETSETSNSFEFSSYPFGYARKIEKGKGEVQPIF